MAVWKLALTLLLLGAASSPTILPPGYGLLDGESLVIPPDSPVKFKRWTKDGYAVFEGRFEATGTFTYGCFVDCEEGQIGEDQIRTDFVPDSAIAVRLPHWKLRNSGISLVLFNDRALAKAVADPKLHAAIRAGKVAYVQGRATIVVEDFQTGIECDAANYSARLVKIIGAPKVESVKLGGHGCL